MPNFNTTKSARTCNITGISDNYRNTYSNLSAWFDRILELQGMCLSCLKLDV